MGRLQVFGTYQLIERIGVGAMGEVYRAVSRRDGRVVTIKRLMASANGKPEAVASLRGEAELLRVLDHPGIAKVVDVGEADGVNFIAYEFIPGRDLRAIQERALRKGPPPPSGRRSPTFSGEHPAELVPIDVALHIVMRVAEALAHAHARTDAQGKPLALVHRDVSPPNILVSFDGRVKLLDFGIARTADRLVRTDAGQVKGTLGYMSPEQLRGDEIDARSDLYSLGVCLWELCTGKRLFEGLLPHEVLRRITHGDFPPARFAGAKISEELDAVILKALAHSRDKRYPTASELHAELAVRAGAERLLTDSIRVARYVRSLFPEAAAEEAASREESLDMADNKGGSDLDVFEGLAKKTRTPAPGLTPPPASQARKSTLLGGLGPLPPPIAPPSAASAPPPLPPPPPASAAKPGSLPPPVAPPKAGTLPGISAPPAPLAPPSKLPVPPPPASPAAAAPPPLPAPAPPPAPLPAPAPPPKAGTLPGLTPPPLPPPTTSISAPLPPPAPPPKTVTPLPPPAVLPPPAPPPDKAAGKAAVDMDWDDEEESTHVYDKKEHGPRPTKPVKVGAAAALLASSGGAAPAARTTSTAPPAHSVPPTPAVPAEAPPRRDEPTAIRPRGAGAQPATGGSRAGVILGGISLVIVVGLAIFTLLPKKGQFRVNVSAKSGATIGAVDIYVEGQKKCETTPCVIHELEPGTKTIRVIAPGFPPTEATETVEAGKEKVIFVSLESGGSAPPPPTTTGPAPAAGMASLKISGTEAEKSVRVLVDGVDKGTLPLDMREIAPGTHKIRFEGGERYEKLEQVVEIGAGQAKDLGEVKLKVVKGQVTLDLATPGVAITLVNKKGDKKKLTDAILKNPPIKLDIDPHESWRIVAAKKGFDEFNQELTFEDGQAEKTIRIVLAEAGKASVAIAPSTGPAPTPSPTPAPTPTPVVKPDPPASGSGTLNINSIPVSKVILDGKPLGSTPKVGVSVSAGSHTVTFVHPEQGKKSVTVTVKAGETKTAAVKF